MKQISTEFKTGDLMKCIESEVATYKISHDPRIGPIEFERYVGVSGVHVFLGYVDGSRNNGYFLSARDGRIYICFRGNFRLA
jgi:hypothetical protein